MSSSLASFFTGKISIKQRAFVMRQMGLMLSSGVPLATALTLASQQTDNQEIRQALRAINRDVEAGYSLSSAAAKYPHLFDRVTVALIKSGEASGNLQQILVNLADELEKDSNFSEKIRNTLLYPAFVVLVMIIVGIIMTTVIIPRLTVIFEDTKIALPFATRMLVAISNGIIHYWYILVLMLIGLYLALRSYLATNEGRATYYRLQLSIPGVRAVVESAYLVRFTRILGMLVRSGVAITTALDLVSDSLSNRMYVQALRSVRNEVEKGIPLSTAMSRHKVFPKPLVQMIAVGEQTGRLDEVLDNMERAYEDQATSAVAAITSLIEPILLVIVAIAAGFVVLAVILPIYGLAEQF